MFRLSHCLIGLWLADMVYSCNMVPATLMNVRCCHRM